MRTISFTVALALTACNCLPSCAQQAPKTYLGHHTDARIKVDGILDKGEWKRATLIRDFIYAWEGEKPPPTAFWAQTDDSLFNFSFRVKDKDIVLHDYSRESDVAEGDRVEIFFAGDLDLKDYYCLEIRPDGRVLDYKASYYRRFDDTWDFDGLEVKTEIGPSGYTVEGRIPLKTLNRLGIATQGHPSFFIGLFRAEYISSESGPAFVKWISWVRPDSPEPDFHIPSALGRFFSSSKAMESDDSAKAISLLRFSGGK